MAEPGKTEKATPKKREEARKRGQIVRSVEINSMLNVLICLIVLKIFGGYIFDNIKMLSSYFWDNVTTIAITPDAMGSFVNFIISKLLLIILPIFVAVFIIGILSNVLQFGFLITFEPLKPSFDKINPFRGLKRLFSKRMLFELGKSIIKIFVISYIFYSMIKKIFNEIFITPLMDIETYLSFSADIVFSLGIKITVAFIIFSILDYIYQKYEYEDNLMMSKQEVKDELKQLEGDPLIKARIRNIQREIARRRMISEIPQADVVITNPNHIAIAIRYKEGDDNAPKIVAKGINLMAEKIKNIARENGIIIVENPPLARVLVKLEIGWEIPPELFQAMAEILAFVYQSKGKFKLEENEKNRDNINRNYYIPGIENGGN
ncbi:MAG: flagellar biosynthesis protein FlhB [Candidatus Goldbacteria bacterium]|nr:flagellar biosynthesis protein FlhB [Candidatus Goldiibacteriota bacterium]